MKMYILRRILLMIPTFIGITFVTFIMTQFVPGGPIDQLRARAQAGSASGEAGARGGFSKRSDSQLSEADLKGMMELYGFDKPWYVQYAKWLTRVFQFDLGESFRYFTPVSQIISSKLPVSIFYGLVSTFLVYLISVPLGVIKAIRHKTWIDNVTSIIIFVGYAIPAFALAMVLIVFLASKWSIFPLGGFVSDDFEYLPTFGAKALDIFKHAFLPLVAYMVGSFASMTILMKNSVMEQMASDYVKTALAKGVSYRWSIFRHALRNSLIPLATSFGNNLSVLLAGSFLIEKIFNIDGMGLLGYTSIVERDYPVVLGILVISSLLTLVGNLLSDLCVAAVDPRVRFR
ncbi:MAG TPA: ABC transporter permease subunit [Pseudobdellovibrionaceae bacterium]|nr:ABC transporter permease subunit [Pseudobdellovibrionaceae bacterium]